MFVALRENGEYISLVTKGNRNELLELRKRETFTCPACKHGVQLKLGTKITHHFAHLKGAECTVKTEPESEYHLRGKRQLFNWFKAQTYQVELEPFLPDISQRPDLLVTLQDKRYAIEYQCSPIEYSLFKKRTDSFKKLGIVPIWILGAKWFNRKSANTISLSSFQWFFARTNLQHKNPTILYYCPESSHFLKVTNITPFTSSEAICTINPLKEGKTTLPTLLEPLPLHTNFTKFGRKKRLSGEYNILLFLLKPLS
ncbi:competence protein CoiA [Fredinandcohnia sp. 179-A 10B2 NHS]|uniref:competence protein CoiA n=1 Tax=Fredinandcohnia sp. 179-A 10B2 NHS TaxID=3235176 RepID=UPI00399F13C6